MRIAYFDCFSGISGDMVLGALVDAGLDSRQLVSALEALGIKGFKLSFKKEIRGYLAGTRADVQVEEGPGHRHLPKILRILDESTLSDGVKERSAAIFRRLAEAEAAVHGISPEEVHFHEVGALDAIADIVGAVAGLELLGIEKVYTSPLALGKGCVKCEHGVLPLPAPAVSKLVKGFSVRFTDLERELTTPTGAAIVTTLSERGGIPPAFTVEQTGYGFGLHSGDDLPNALRLFVGNLAQEGLEEVVLLETNLDDVTGELMGYLMERCFEEGALDVFAVPVQMKKSRPGVIFSVLCRHDGMDRLLRMIHGESGTLGIRVQRVTRSVLQRESHTVETSLGPVRVKKALVPDLPCLWSPEHADTARIARERGMPLRLVLERIMADISRIEEPPSR